MFSLSSLYGAPLYGSRPGTGPFGFLFSEGQLSDVLGGLLYWHCTALVVIVAIAFIAGCFEDRVRQA